MGQLVSPQSLRDLQVLLFRKNVEELLSAEVIHHQVLPGIGNHQVVEPVHQTLHLQKPLHHLELII